MLPPPIHLAAIDDEPPGDIPYTFTWGASLLSGFVCVLCVSLLVVSARLSPDPSGVGTHSQLGLAPCGFLERTGIACATCGMTTAFALAADGRLLASFVTQPAGALLALITAIAALLSGYASFKGLSLFPLIGTFWRPMTLILFAVVVIGSWIYKIIIMQGI